MSDDDLAAVETALRALQDLVPRLRSPSWAGFEEQSLPRDVLRALIEVVVGSYPTEPQADDLIPGANSLRATQVANLVTDLLDAVGVELFELSMWQAWARTDGGTTRTTGQGRAEKDV